MKRRPVTILTAIVALGAAAMTAWLCVPILQERYYLRLLAEESSGELTEEEAQRAFKQLATLCRCKNLDRLIEITSRFQIESWSQPVELDPQIAAAEVASRCEKTFVRLLEPGVENSLRVSAIHLIETMEDGAAFAEPQLIRILYDSEEQRDIRLEAVDALAMVCDPEEWRALVNDFLDVEPDFAMRIALVGWIHAGSLYRTRERWR